MPNGHVWIMIAFQIGFYFWSSDFSVYVFQELSVYISFLTTADEISTNQNAAIFSRQTEAQFSCCCLSKQWLAEISWLK